jgi:hypothetical protein
LEEVQQKFLSLELAAVEAPGYQGRLYVNYRNLGKVYFKLLSVKPEESGLVNLDDSAGRALLQGLPVLKSWSVELPKAGDMDHHRIELPIPAMPSGNYWVMATESESADIEEEDAVIVVGRHDVSHLGFVVRHLEPNLHEVTVADRVSGRPIQGVEVDLVFDDYDYQRRRLNYDLKPYGKTDSDGKIMIRLEQNNYRNFRLKLTHQGHSWVMGDPMYQYNLSSPRNDYDQAYTIFFTDRAMYRPGQTIQFKGLMVKKSGGRHELMPGQTSEVRFTDVNGQEIELLRLTTNSMGAFSGSFTAPRGRLTGQMHISGVNGRIGVSVEEYKRPKFKVEMDAVKGSFKLGETVQVTGSAEAYSGPSVADAAVKYRVVRSASYPYCDWGRWRPLPVSPEVEVAHGSIATDSEGKFKLSFQAMCDDKVDAAALPQFSFRVEVDVVDATGETHSGSTHVDVGSIALSASISMPTALQKGKPAFLEVRTRNLNGEFESASGRVRIELLELPTTALHDRISVLPDIDYMNEAEFRAAYPHHAYWNEHDPAQWKVSKLVSDLPFDTGKNDSLPLGDLGKWTEGMYRAVLETRDAFGTPVKHAHHFWVFAKESKTRSIGGFYKAMPLDEEVQPGENAELVVAAAEDGMMLRVDVERNGKILSQEWVELHAGTQTLRFPVKEEDRGNFAVHLLGLRKGGLFAETHMFRVPWKNKQLQVEFATFRSKLLPGQDEEWQLRIKGPNGEKVTAEVLAGMYDASLDAFRSAPWGLDLWPMSYPRHRYQENSSWQLVGAWSYLAGWQLEYQVEQQQYDEIEFLSGYVVFDSYARGGKLAAQFSTSNAMMAPMAEDKRAEVDSFLDEGNTRKAERTADGQESTPTIRKNLQETAFFYPHLKTDDAGNVVIAFKVPEALTTWKFRALAYTSDLKTGYVEKEVVTQKDLMVSPNPPRFFREYDKVQFTAKVSNLSSSNLKGDATLQLFDAITMQPVDVQFSNQQPKQPFEVASGQSVVVKWALRIPVGIQAVVYRVVAKSGDFSDGEEGALPVMSNTLLLTESMSLPVRAGESKTFMLDKLINNKSPTIRHHRFTLEFTSNPAWYAVQALPYLMEYPYECVEQTFSRFYANALASHVANSNPRIKQVFDAWAASGSSESLLSNLEKNQELKSLLLEETPWVMDAGNESERKKRIALLFDLNRMASEREVALAKVRDAQLPDGSWSWFPGMKGSRTITQHVVAGIGHLEKLGVRTAISSAESQAMLTKAIQFLDETISEDLARLKAYKVNLEDYQTGHEQVHLLYARSFFRQIPVDSKHQPAYDYYLRQIKKYWTRGSRLQQGMEALVLFRAGFAKEANQILEGLRQTSVKHPEMGMYWKDNISGYRWHEAPVETQSLLVEAFHEIAHDREAVEEMKLWLLKQKQTQDWKTTKATAEACYALLLTGNDILSNTKMAMVSVGDIPVDPAQRPDIRVEAGTGYYKTHWNANEIRPEMGKVRVSNPNEGAAWGAVYWQYFERMDQITAAKTQISVTKELYRKENTDKGPKLAPLAVGEAFRMGDRVQVRMVLKTDRDMEYVHIKDMRGSGFEPEDVLSGYRYQDGFGYYQSTRDAATNIFIDYLPKGTYVFEYSLRATHEGDFSNGITTFQCMYAPEFTSHTPGIRVQVAP